MNDFYFRSYERIVGKASNLEELKIEMMRLSREDPECVNYHLREGHIVQWLRYMGESQAAVSLSGVGDVLTALRRLNSLDHGSKGRGMGHGGTPMQGHRKGRPRKAENQVMK